MIARSRLIDLVALPEFVGCADLSAMLGEPQRYGVGRSLVEKCIWSFYRLLWRGNSKMVLEILEGEHEEESVLIVPSCGGAVKEASCIPVVPKSSEPAFVLHCDASRWVRRFIVRRAAQSKRFGAFDSLHLEEIANELGRQLFQLSVLESASNLTLRSLKPCT